MRETTAYRWSRLIQHHPWPAAIAGVLVLVILALPVLGLRLGFPDEGNYPEDTSTRRAYDMRAEGFGPGFNGPLVLASLVPGDLDPEALEQVERGGRRRPGRRVRQPGGAGRSRGPVRGRVAGHPDHRAPGRGHHRHRRPPARHGDPRGHRRHRARRGRHRHRGRRRRLLRVPGRAPAGVLRRGVDAVVPAADGRVPVAARAAEGRGHEPAVDRRRLRRRGRGRSSGAGRARSSGSTAPRSSPSSR